MTNHSVIIEGRCLPGHQREQSLVHHNFFINKLKYRISNILKKLVDDAKCAGDVKKMNQDLDLIITAWIKSS